MFQPVVELAPLTDANRAAVLALAIHDHQRLYLSTPDIADFLADAYDHPEFTPLAIVSSGQVVACVSVGTLDELGRWWIPLLIVDRERHGQGIGRATLVLVISVIRAIDRTAVSIGLSCHPQNAAAMHLYRSLGFEADGVDTDGEARMCLRL